MHPGVFYAYVGFLEVFVTGSPCALLRGRFSSSRLAGGTEMGGALGNDQAGHLTMAAPAESGIASLKICLEMIVIFSHFSAQAAIAAEGCAAILDAFCQDSDNPRVQ